jgi:hypothetical protein
MAPDTVAKYAIPYPRSLEAEEMDGLISYLGKQMPCDLRLSVSKAVKIVGPPKAGDEVAVHVEADYVAKGVVSLPYGTSTIEAKIYADSNSLLLWQLDATSSDKAKLTTAGNQARRLVNEYITQLDEKQADQE